MPVPQRRIRVATMVAMLIGNLKASLFSLPSLILSSLDNGFPERVEIAISANPPIAAMAKPMDWTIYGFFINSFYQLNKERK